MKAGIDRKFSVGGLPPLHIEARKSEYTKHFQHSLSVSNVYLLYEQTCLKTSMFHKACYLASLIFPQDGNHCNEQVWHFQIMACVQHRYFQKWLMLNIIDVKRVSPKCFQPFTDDYFCVCVQGRASPKFKLSVSSFPQHIQAKSMISCELEAAVCFVQ